MTGWLIPWTLGRTKGIEDSQCSVDNTQLGKGWTRNAEHTHCIFPWAISTLASSPVIRTPAQHLVSVVGVSVSTEYGKSISPLGATSDAGCKPWHLRRCQICLWQSSITRSNWEASTSWCVRDPLTTHIYRTCINQVLIDTAKFWGYSRGWGQFLTGCPNCGGYHLAGHLTRCPYASP
jgi:hypothetical protein